MRLTISGDGTTYDVTSYILTANLKGDYQSCARQLEVQLASTPISGNIAPCRCEIMDGVVLYDDSNDIAFIGKIWARQKSTNGNSIDITCFDDGFYLNKNKASYKFSNTTPENIVKRICTDYGVPRGDIAKTKVNITRNFLGNSLYQMIQTAYTLASEQTGDMYQVIFKKGKLCVIKRGIDADTVVIDGELMDASITESAEKVISRVKIYDKNDKFVRNVDNTAAIKQYGILQDYIKRTDKDDGTAKAKKILKDRILSQKITINALGDIRCITGGTVVVREAYTGVYGLFYIDADTHTWKNGQYYNKLTLNFRNIMDEQEAGQLPSSSSKKSKSNNNSGKKNASSDDSGNTDRWQYINKPK